MNKRYRVLQNLTRKADGSLFTPGQEVELDLSRAGERQLVEMGVIEPIEEKQPKKESKKEEVSKNGD
jgi:hypothetical protein